MMTAPAIIRPKEIDTNIGPTSHSRRSNFWVLAMRTAFLWRECKISVTGSCQAWTVIVTADALSITMSRGIARNRRRAEGLRQCRSGSRSVSVDDTSVREGTVFRYIDSLRRAKLDIGCRSIHMTNGSSRRVPERGALPSTNPMNDIDQRHVASICALWVRTVYARRTCLRTGRSQALGGQRSPAMEQHPLHR